MSSRSKLKSDGVDRGKTLKSKPKSDGVNGEVSAPNPNLTWMENGGGGHQGLLHELNSFALSLASFQALALQFAFSGNVLSL
ncbi:uncharacterized protein A4U43_C08F7310 [Asparagus officinalis]|nr:uncharacterized protein A4U43_C08F7310 [Asparagus officinalis]